MKVTAKISLRLCVVVSIFSSTVVGQTSNPPKPSNQTNTSTKPVKPGTDELREYQLLTIREHVLSRILAGIKKMDEAGLRVSARNQLLTYLATDKTPSDAKQTLITQVAIDANFLTEHAPQMAYDLLTRLLPVIQQSIPELYDEALNQQVAMRAALTDRQLAGDARVKRLKESANPIEDLISEAESVKSKSERNELLLQAAQLALEKQRFDLCLEILSDVDVRVTEMDAGSLQRSVDQTLKNFVRVALTKQRAELAEKAAARINSSLTHVEALGLIMRTYTKANKTDAQRLLTDASKVAASALDNTEKAKSFFLLSVMCDQVDRSKKADLLLSGINAVNNIAKPDAATRDTTGYQSYVQRLDNSGYELTKGFNGLTKQDENAALALVEKLEKPDLKSFALLGILLGLDHLLTEPTH